VGGVKKGGLVLRNGTVEAGRHQPLPGRACPGEQLCENDGMSKNLQQLEARLDRVEKELAELRAQLARKHGTPWYRQIVGDFAGDPDFAEIIRLGKRARAGKLKG
jgi:hypothetical protein